MFFGMDVKHKQFLMEAVETIFKSVENTLATSAENIEQTIPYFHRKYIAHNS